MTGKAVVSPYTAVEEAKMKRFVLFFVASWRTFRVPVTLTSCVSSGLVTDSETSIRAAKCTIVSTSLMAAWSLLLSRMSPYLNLKFGLFLASAMFSSFPECRLSNAVTE